MGLATQGIYAIDSDSQGLSALKSSLSPTAKVLLRGEQDWNEATKRWSEWCRPGLDLAVEVAIEEDVCATVRWANDVGRPFLAISGAHGSTMGLARVGRGVGIIMRRLDDVRLKEGGDGSTVIAGGGCISGPFLKRLWELGKMSVAGCCETTGVVAPMLGGGHGFLQGQYGLMSDQLVSARLVTATGDIVTVSADEHPDLYWALRGAGHNFGVVTEFEYRVYDRTPQNETWSYEFFIFKGEQLEHVYTSADRMVGPGMPVELLHFTLMANNPAIDQKPVIIFFLLYHSDSIPAKYSEPLASLNPVVHNIGTTDFIGLPGVMGFSANSPSCLPGKDWLRFPASAKAYSIPALRRAYDTYASFPPKLAEHSSVITEAYSVQGMQAIPKESTAVPDRGNYLIMAMFVAYEPEPGDHGQGPDEEGVRLGKLVQNYLAQGADEDGGKEGLDAYVNYAFGDEGPEAWYGREAWRLEKLREVKRAWDPEGRFGWYCPIE